MMLRLLQKSTQSVLSDPGSVKSKSSGEAMDRYCVVWCSRLWLYTQFVYNSILDVGTRSIDLTQKFVTKYLQQKP